MKRRPARLEHSVVVPTLAPSSAPAYGEAPFLPRTDSAMSSRMHRYRITVTPIESDGLQCSGRCTIEFEQRSPQNWMHQLEAAQSQRRLSCNEVASAVVATGLLENLASIARQGDNVLSALHPELDALLGKLAQLHAAE